MRVPASAWCPYCHGRGHIRVRGSWRPCTCTHADQSTIDINQSVNSIGTSGRRTIADLLADKDKQAGGQP